MANKCCKCGSTDNYNFALNIRMCNVCIGKELEQIKELEVENEGLKLRLEEWRNKAIGYKCDYDDLLSENAKLKELIAECIRIAGQNHWDTKRGSPENKVWQRLKKIYIKL